MRSTLLILGLTAGMFGAAPAVAAPPQTQCAPSAALPAPASPVAFWSTEARCAIVPPGGGPENFGNKFAGEAAVYAGIVHVAIYHATLASERRVHRPGSRRPSASAAIATATYRTLAGLQPVLALDADGQAILQADYSAYMASIPDGAGKEAGAEIGRRVADAVLAWRAGDGLEKNPALADLDPPPPGPGVWRPSAAPALGLRLPGVRPLVLRSASQFQPGPPPALTSDAYADDVNEIQALGSSAGLARTPEQTIQARFWTDPDLRQWNDGLLRLAAARGLGLVQAARMLAMAHTAGADAIIACFDAKYHYWFWRPFQAIQQADVDGNPFTIADASWQPLATTPNHPEYPSAHACHSAAVVTALQAFFGTDDVPLTLDSRVTGTTRSYARLHDVVDDVEEARILVGFHFRTSVLVGAELGREVGGYDAAHGLRPRR